LVDEDVGEFHSLLRPRVLLSPKIKIKRRRHEEHEEEPKNTKRAKTFAVQTAFLRVLRVLRGSIFRPLPSSHPLTPPAASASDSLAEASSCRSRPACRS